VIIDMIAAAAGVGKQTIYRWWPSKGAVLLEAMTDLARTSAPTPDSGSLAGDLKTFVSATFRSAGAEPASSRLDQVYGVLWYRLMISQAPLTARVANRLTTALLRQFRPS
jgi:AcrR family transcriptional regulator